MVEDAAGAREIGEEFFFGAEFAGVRDQSAAGAPRGMLDVQHLVVQNVFDGAARDRGAVHAAIQQNLVGAGIVAAELAAPASCAPADSGALQSAGKKTRIQIVEHLIEIEVLPLRTGVLQSNTGAAHLADAASRAVRTRVTEIRLDQRFRRAAAINAREQQRRGGFQHLKRRAQQQIGKAYVHQIFAAANSEHQTRVRIKLHAKTRRAAFATDARVHALEKRRSSGNARLAARHHAQFLRRTGGGATFILACSASFKASLVPSIASSKLSL